MFDLAIQEFDGEPRALDLDIAEALGFERFRNIRKLINRHIAALSEIGEVRSTWSEPTEVGGRLGNEFWLNEKQALFITAKSDTPNAALIVIEMVEVFTAWKAGKLPRHGGAQSPAHLPVDADTWLSAIREARLILGEAAAVKLWQQSPLPDLPVPLEKVDKKDRKSNLSFINRFIEEQCVVTGHTRDWVSSADFIIAVGDWLEGEGQMRWTSTTIARAFAKACSKYKPRKGQPNFTAHKSSRMGYLGIVLNGLD